MRPLNVGERFALANFCVAFFLVAALVYAQAGAAKQAIRERARAEAAVSLEQTAALCRSRLAKGQTRDLFNDLKPLAELERFAYIDVLAPGGGPLLQLTNPGHHRGLTQDIPAGRPQNDVLRVSEDILDGRKSLGRLEIGLWVQGIEAGLRRIERQGLLAGTLLCFGMALVSWLLGDGLAARLRRLTAGILSQAPGDFRHIAPAGSDEVATLARAFNERQDRLLLESRRREAAEAARRDVVNMIIHDMKGPLTVYRSGLPFLRETARELGDERVRKMLELFTEASQRLTRMTEEILRMARLEDEELPLARETLDVDSLISARLESAQVAAQAKGLQARRTSSSELPGVQGDREMLGRVIDNLLFNAIEHTPAGGEITVRVGGDAAGVRVEVEDTGPGVPPEDRCRIFEKFRKGRAASQGVGLGLAFCKAAVERHGGTIGVGSAEGGGAVFHFTLPAARV